MSDSTRKILMVDDEENILKGLGRRLKSIQVDWDVVAATSGEEALKLMEEKEFDLVISDLQMPVMDGAEFLGLVRDRHPLTLRFVLSGHADQALMFKAMQLAHQYFFKPCDTLALADVIMDVLQSTESMRMERLKEVIIHLNQFPALPALYDELIKLLENPSKGMSEIADLIAKDPAIASKVIQVANSAFFGGHHISGIKEAVSMMGTESIKALILVVKFFDSVPHKRAFVISQEFIWLHSLHVASLAGKILENVFNQPKLIDEGQTVALLHDLGKWMLSDFFGERYNELIRSATQKKEALWKLEKETFDITHAEIGAMLFKLWGLPDRIVEPIRWQHEPMKATDISNPEVLAALHVADRLEYRIFGQKDYIYVDFDVEFLQKMGLSPEMSFWEEKKVIS